jgi:protein SCO1/2
MVLDPAKPAPEFQLVDQNGQPFRLSDHRGQVVALFFGYTHCPDVCPLTLGYIATASSQLGVDAPKVQFVFVTVDPERDSPERLNEYLSRVYAPIAGLSGPNSDIERVWSDYGILVKREPRDDGSYFVGHSAQMTLVDASGQVRDVLPMGSDGDDLLNDIRWLILQQG